jgi:hypothetical protein
VRGRLLRHRRAEKVEHLGGSLRDCGDDRHLEVEQPEARKDGGKAGRQLAEVAATDLRVDVDLADAERDGTPDVPRWQAGRSMQRKR